MSAGRRAQWLLKGVCFCLVEEGSKSFIDKLTDKWSTLKYGLSHVHIQLVTLSVVNLNLHFQTCFSASLPLLPFLLSFFPAGFSPSKRKKQTNTSDMCLTHGINLACRSLVQIRLSLWNLLWNCVGTTPVLRRRLALILSQTLTCFSSTASGALWLWPEQRHADLFMTELLWPFIQSVIWDTCLTCLIVSPTFIFSNAD